MKVQKEVEAKTIRLHAKVCDSGHYTLLDDEGTTLKEHDGYVPDFFPEDHYGGYLDLEIDIDTGMITNWKKPSPEQLQKFVGEECE
jgi:hypothetical protein